jgi:hypothetical protein
MFSRMYYICALMFSGSPFVQHVMHPNRLFLIHNSLELQFCLKSLAGYPTAHLSDGDSWKETRKLLPGKIATQSYLGVKRNDLRPWPSFLFVYADMYASRYPDHNAGSILVIERAGNTIQAQSL